MADDNLPSWEFKIASQDGILPRQEAVERVLKVISEVVKQPGVAHAFVTDESWVWDFLDVDPDVASHQVRKISAALGGFDVRPNTPILDLAKWVSQ